MTRPLGSKNIARTLTYTILTDQYFLQITDPDLDIYPFYTEFKKKDTVFFHKTFSVRFEHLIKLTFHFIRVVEIDQE